MALKPTMLDKPGVDDPMLPVDFVPNSFAKAIEVAAASEAANVYTADLKRDWVIGLGIFDFLSALFARPLPFSFFL